MRRHEPPSKGMACESRSAHAASDPAVSAPRHVGSTSCWLTLHHVAYQAWLEIVPSMQNWCP